MPQDQDKSEGSKASEKSAAFKENVIRIVTVFAYVSSVSMAALVLSSYYVFFWEPKPPGPGPPVIHPHAYVADPHPPLKLVGLPPEGHETEGASFWKSVWSYIKPDESSSSMPFDIYTRTNPTTADSYNHYFPAIATIPDTVNDTNDEMSTRLITILGTDYTTLLPSSETSYSDESINKINPTKVYLKGYVGIIPNRARRGMESRKSALEKKGSLNNGSTTTDTEAESKGREFKSITTTPITKGYSATENTATNGTGNDKDYNNASQTMSTDDVETITTTARPVEVESTEKKVTKRNINRNETEHDEATTYKGVTTTTRATTSLEEVDSTGTNKNKITKHDTNQTINNKAIANTRDKRHEEGTITTARLMEVETAGTTNKITKNEHNTNQSITDKDYNKVIAETGNITTKTARLRDVESSETKNKLSKRNTYQNSTEYYDENHNIAITHREESTDEVGTITTARLVEVKSAGTIKTTNRNTNYISTDERSIEQEGLTPATIELNETAANNFDKNIGTKSVSLDYSDIEKADSVATFSDNSENKTPDYPTTNTSFVTEPRESSVNKTTDSSVSIVIDDQTTTKATDPVIIEQMEFDTQYQHHMRQLRPRRKFPSL